MSKTPEGATPLGNHLYIFESPFPTNECLITAHGDDANEDFYVPDNVVLNFYSDHEHMLGDPGVDFLSRHPIPKTSVRGSGMFNDYELSKYQGKHNSNNETYSSIYTQVINSSRIAANSRDDHERFAGIRDRSYKAHRNNEIKPGTAKKRVNVAINIVTIRNRWNSSGCNLSYVVDKVTRAYPHINVFHCSFCRGGESTQSPAFLGRKAR